MENAHSMAEPPRVPSEASGTPPVSTTQKRPRAPAEAETRSRVRHWLQQLGTHSDSRRVLDRLQALELVDDIVTLLLDVPEVKRASEMRPQSVWPWAPPWERVEVGDLVIDGATREALLFGKAITLEPMERSLLEYLVVHRARVVGREELLRSVWGGGRFRSRVADAYVGRIRKKIEGANVAIATIRGAGYRLVEVTASSDDSREAVAKLA
jgi:DNA-binding winged helix-turn-helix (wHTH) protein